MNCDQILQLAFAGAKSSRGRKVGVFVVCGWPRNRSSSGLVPDEHASDKACSPEEPLDMDGVKMSSTQRSEMEKALVAVVLWARAKPEEVCEQLEKRLAHFRGKEYFPPDQPGRSVVTKEGSKAVLEAIAYVKQLRPVRNMKRRPEEGLALAAHDHVIDVGSTGVASHTSSDGMRPHMRAARYGRFRVHGELLWYGWKTYDALNILLDLATDDGVPERSHCRGIFDENFTSVGVSYGVHKTFGRMAAIEFAEDWRPNKGSIRKRQAKGPVCVSPEAQAQAMAVSTTEWNLGTCLACK